MNSQAKYLARFCLILTRRLLSLWKKINVESRFALTCPSQSLSGSVVKQKQILCNSDCKLQTIFFSRGKQALAGQGINYLPLLTVPKNLHNNDWTKLSFEYFVVHGQNTFLITKTGSSFCLVPNSIRKRDSAQVCRHKIWNLTRLNNFYF